MHRRSSALRFLMYIAIITLFTGCFENENSSVTGPTIVPPGGGSSSVTGGWEGSSSDSLGSWTWGSVAFYASAPSYDLWIRQLASTAEPQQGGMTFQRSGNAIQITFNGKSGYILLDGTRCPVSINFSGHISGDSMGDTMTGNYTGTGGTNLAGTGCYGSFSGSLNLTKTHVF